MAPIIYVVSSPSGPRGLWKTIVTMCLPVEQPSRSRLDSNGASITDIHTMLPSDHVFLIVSWSSPVKALEV